MTSVGDQEANFATCQDLAKVRPLVVNRILTWKKSLTANMHAYQEIASTLTFEMHYRLEGS